jgi:hypothetical protein
MTTKAWSIRADYTVYADNIEEAITKWLENTDTVALNGDVIFDGLDEVFEFTEVPEGRLL